MLAILVLRGEREPRPLAESIRLRRCGDRTVHGCVPVRTPWLTAERDGFVDEARVTQESSRQPLIVDHLVYDALAAIAGCAPI